MIIVTGIASFNVEIQVGLDMTEAQFDNLSAAEVHEILQEKVGAIIINGKSAEIVNFYADGIYQLDIINEPPANETELTIMACCPRCYNKEIKFEHNFCKICGINLKESYQALKRTQLLKRANQFRFVPGHGPDFSKMTYDTLELTVGIMESAMKKAFQEKDEFDDDL